MAVDGGGRSIETPSAFAEDEGVANHELAVALADYQQAKVSYIDVVSVLKSCRLLVPVVAVLEERDDSGADKSSHMATVTLVQADGRRGLLAFTSIEHLHRWDPQARPVPAFAVDVCAAAIQEGAHGVLIDISGPVRFAVDNDALTWLASFSASVSEMDTHSHEPGSTPSRTSGDP
jgi:hypothetical protein